MIFIYLLYVYLVFGLGFAVWFSFFKLEKTDEAAKGTSIWFKLIILPGLVLLWPVVWFKLLKEEKHESHPS